MNDMCLLMNNRDEGKRVASKNKLFPAEFLENFDEISDVNPPNIAAGHHTKAPNGTGTVHRVARTHSGLFICCLLISSTLIFSGCEKKAVLLFSILLSTPSDLPI
uniref:Uncharacterized protein n=1 Tax=Caenorhabditis tropicalis TaxID=1561998 RepID=A0A1I7TJJ1_9PELO